MSYCACRCPRSGSVSGNSKSGKCIGPTTLTEIKTKLSALGLTLRPGHRCPRKTRASEVASRPAVDRVVDLERLLRCSDCLHRGASAWVRWAETVAFPRTVAPQS